MLEFIQSADWSILHWIQENLRCGALDALLPKLTLLGEAGAIWIAVAMGLLLTKKYRKYGVCLSLALVAGLLICNVGLKNIVARPRPCWLESIDLLVKNPRDYSFPSGHTWSAVAGAWVATAANRRFGYAAIPLAAALAFSRLYLFVHFPSDVLAGALMGALLGLLAAALQKRLPGNLKAMQKAGTDVVIVANYGLPNIPINSAYANQTDILIDTKYASVGATTADYGKTLKRTGAHVSPDRIVDAATCLLPNNTWFFKGVAHVNFWYDSQATKFLAGLITNPKKKQSVQTVKAATGNGQFVNTDEKQNIVPFSAGKSTNSSGTKNTNPKNTATAAMKSPATGAHWSLAVGGSGLAASGLLFALYALFGKKKNDAATK